MNIFKSGIRSLGAAVLLTAAVGCSDDDSSLNSSANLEFNAFNAINANGNNTSLYRAIVNASGGLEATLSGPGPFTVFAPSDAAFEALAGSLGYSNAQVMITGSGDVDPVSPDALASILTYHVVSGEAPSSSLSDDQEITTVQGEVITVDITDDGVFLLDKTERAETSTSAKVTSTDLEVTNGIIHGINKVLLPQAIIDAVMLDTRPTVLQLAVANEGLTVLEDAVIKAGLTELLSTKNTDDDGNELGYTVLAPTDAAFADLLDFLGDDYNSLDDFDNATEMQLLTEILSYHVIPERLDAEMIQTGDLATALEGASVEVTAASANSIEISDATGDSAASVALDVQGSNGTVHVIDRVLLPQAAVDFLDLLNSPDLASVVGSQNNLGSLEAALVKTELAELFVDETNESLEEGDEAPSNFTYFQNATVFAPTNAAFTALFELLGDDYNSLDDFDTDDEIELLTNILLYHVVSGKVISGDLSDGMAIEMQASGSIQVLEELGTGKLLLQDATTNSDTEILTADVQARNGVAHIIDDILLSSEAIAFINSLNETEEEGEEAAK